VKHSFIDKYTSLNSVIHKLDPRVKFISTIFYIICIILLSPKDLFLYIAYFLVIFIVILLSKLPLIFVLKKSLTIIPFVIIIALFLPFYDNSLSISDIYKFKFSVSNTGIRLFLSILAKSLLSILSLIVLTTTTKFTLLLKGLRKLYIPDIFILLLSFMYRYIFVLIDESQKMNRARRVKTFNTCFSFRNIKYFSQMIGVLFLKTFEKSELIYYCMLARGYSGEIFTIDNLELKKLDFISLSVFILILVGLRLWLKL